MQRVAAGDRYDTAATLAAQGWSSTTPLVYVASGEAILHHTFYDYQPTRGHIPARLNGVLVSTETGRATPYALESIQDRKLKREERIARQTRKKPKLQVLTGGKK